MTRRTLTQDYAGLVRPACAATMLYVELLAPSISTFPRASAEANQKKAHTSSVKSESIRTLVPGFCVGGVTDM